MQKAKAEAAARNQTVGVIFAPVVCMAAPVTTVPSPGGSYQVFVDDGSGGGVAGNLVLDGGEQVINNVTMPNNVALCATNFTFGATTVGFTSRGVPVFNRIGSATISNDQNRTIQLTLSTAGVIRLQ